MANFGKFMKKGSKQEAEEQENEEPVEQVEEEQEEETQTQEQEQHSQASQEEEETQEAPVENELADMKVNLQASQMIDLENLAERYGVELSSVASQYDANYGAYEIFGQTEAHEMTITKIEKSLEKLGEVVYRRVLILGKYWEYWSEKPDDDDKPERVHSSVLSLVYDPDEDKNILQELRYTDRDGTKMYENLKRATQLTIYDDVKLRMKNGYYNLDVNSYFGEPTFLAEIDESFANMTEPEAFKNLMGEDFIIHNSWEQAGYSKQNNGFTDKTDLKAVRVIVRKGDYKENKKAPENSIYKDVYMYQADCLDFGRNPIRLVFPSFPEFEIPKLFGRSEQVYLIVYGPIDHFAGTDKLTVYQCNELSRDEAKEIMSQR